MTVEYLKESHENVDNEKILWLVTKRKRFHLVIITAFKFPIHFSPFIS